MKTFKKWYEKTQKGWCIQVYHPMEIAWNAALREAASHLGSGSTPIEPQHGREPNKVKPLAQYLAEYVAYNIYGHDVDRWGTTKWRELLEQALDAYQSTENVKIRIEPV